MVEIETTKEDGTVLRRCVTGGKNLFESVTLCVLCNYETLYRLTCYNNIG